MEINITELKKAVARWLIENTISKVDTETIQKVLQFGVDKLKELAAGTSTPIDDWAVSEIQNYIQDAAKIEQIRAFIVSKLGKLCSDAPAEFEREWEELAESLATCHDGCCGTPAGSKIIALILSWIIGEVLKHFTETETEN